MLERHNESQFGKRSALGSIQTMAAWRANACLADEADIHGTKCVVADKWIDGLHSAERTTVKELPLSGGPRTGSPGP